MARKTVKKAVKKKTAAPAKSAKKKAKTASVRKKTVWDKLATRKKQASPKKTAKKAAPQKPAAKKTAKKVVKKAVKKKAVSRKKAASSGRANFEVTLIRKKVPSPPAFPASEQSQAVVSQPLPENYGDNMIHVLVRDPEFIYTFWEIQKEHAEGNLAQLGGSWEYVESILRVYDVSEKNEESFFDIPLRHFENNYFIHVEPNRSYVVEIGLLHQDGRYIALAVSNKVTTPRDGASDVLDERWMSVDFDKIYAASGGLDVGLSSLGLKKLMEERLRSSLSSHGSGQAKPSSRMHGDTPVTNITSPLK